MSVLGGELGEGKGHTRNVKTQPQTHKALLVPHVPAPHPRGQEVCFSNHGRGCAGGNIHSWRGTRNWPSAPTPGRGKLVRKLFSDFGKRLRSPEENSRATGRTSCFRHRLLFCFPLRKGKASGSSRAGGRGRPRSVLVRMQP